MDYAKFKEENFPIVEIDILKESPTDVEFKQFLEKIEHYIETHEGFSFVIDTRKTSRLTRHQITQMRDFFSQYKDIIDRNLAGCVYVITSYSVKYFLNGVFLLYKPFVPSVTVRVREQAMKEAHEFISIHKEKYAKVKI
ncbi:MAG: hypothetical protein LAT68_13260 [Cyclobacteriaceae bacterium]|nr:hypothetical protein [Cyclobacteriaceae bacterium]MCH8517288.1 hypothetical protein [Cyclobacteriaceae bacterium]